MKKHLGTEDAAHFSDLEHRSTEELLIGINAQDATVPSAVAQQIPQIKQLVDAIFPRIQKGGRLFYIGSGTSGRLGVVDASECPPTFGVDFNTVIGVIAGGDMAIRKAVENAEDDIQQAERDLQAYQIKAIDTVVGISASGSTPYVLGGLAFCKKERITTGCIVCNKDSRIAAITDYPVEILVGPEFITGSTRMKSGTAQKLALNMLSTTLMIKLGKVKGNKMVDMQLTNAKLIDRGTKMILAETDLSYDEAKQLLLSAGSVRNALQVYLASRNDTFKD